jgi:hypothetical protein
MADFLSKDETLAIVNQYARGAVDSTNPTAKAEAGPTFAGVYLEAFDDARKARDDVKGAKLRHVKDPATLTDTSSEDERKAAAHPHTVVFIAKLRAKLASISVEVEPRTLYRLLLEEGAAQVEAYSAERLRASLSKSFFDDGNPQ